MDVRAGDILRMKKNHPCGSNEFYVIRSGMDFRLRCVKCSREFMIPRNKIEKNIRQIIRSGEGQLFISVTETIIFLKEFFYV